MKIKKMNRSTFIKLLLESPLGAALVRLLNDRYQERRYFKTNSMLRVSGIMGFRYYNGSQVIASINKGENLNLLAEPSNPHDYFDYFAVIIPRRDKLLGCIPRTDNKRITRLLRKEINLNYVVRQVELNADSWKTWQVELYL